MFKEKNWRGRNLWDNITLLAVYSFIPIFTLIQNSILQWLCVGGIIGLLIIGPLASERNFLKEISGLEFLEAWVFLSREEMKPLQLPISRKVSIQSVYNEIPEAEKQRILAQLNNELQSELIADEVVESTPAKKTRKSKAAKPAIVEPTEPAPAPTPEPAPAPTPEPAPAPTPEPATPEQMTNNIYLIYTAKECELNDRVLGKKTFDRYFLVLNDDRDLESYFGIDNITFETYDGYDDVEVKGANTILTLDFWFHGDYPVFKVNWTSKQQKQATTLAPTTRREQILMNMYAILKQDYESLKQEVEKFQIQISDLQADNELLHIKLESSVRKREGVDILNRQPPAPAWVVYALAGWALIATLILMLG